MKSHFRASMLLITLAAVLVVSGCNRGRNKLQEVAYVSAPQAVLRDRIATVYNKTGIVKNGDRVVILERDRRFARVRTADNTEGWVEQRHLVTQQVFDGFQQLVRQEQTSPVQATGVTRNDTNLHLNTGRDADHLYVLVQGAKVSVLKRATSEKALPGAGRAVPTAKLPAKPVVPGAAPISPAMEDWWLIRDAAGHVGWVLARMVDLDVPLEVAQYAEGQRIVAFFVLNEVQDAEKKVPQYLMLLSEPKDGMPFDYNQVRVFTWNARHHRYETAYREHKLNGVLPVTVSHQSFDKDGDLPVFVLRVKDDAGNVVERKYKFNSPMVKRVLAPGEEKQVASPRSSGVRKGH